jgi:hypothetical protein
MVAWRSFLFISGSGEALSVGGVQFELVWASEGAVTAKRCQKITVQKSFLGGEMT